MGVRRGKIGGCRELRLVGIEHDRARGRSAPFRLHPVHRVVSITRHRCDVVLGYERPVRLVPRENSKVEHEPKTRAAPVQVSRKRLVPVGLHVPRSRLEGGTELVADVALGEAAVADDDVDVDCDRRGRTAHAHGRPGGQRVRREGESAGADDEGERDASHGAPIRIGLSRTDAPWRASRRSRRGR